MSNARNSNYRNPVLMETWIRFHENTKSSIYYQKFLIDSQRIIENANKIHKATITTIIFHPTTEELVTGLATEKLLLTRKLFPKNEYKIGLGFTTNICLLQSQNTTQSNILNQVKQNLELVDFLHLDNLNITNSDISVNVEIAKLVNFHKACVQTLQGKDNSEMKFSFSVGWSDTTDDGIINYERFVHRWKAIIGTLKTESFTLLMVEAFDNPNLKLESTFGWWRLRENSAYQAASQFEFDDKKKIANREIKKTPEYKLSLLEKNITFNRERTTIRLSQTRTKVDTALFLHTSATLISSQISTISTKFSSLMIHDEDFLITENTYQTYVRINDILNAIAEHNNKSENTLKVTLGCVCKTRNDINSVLNSISRTNSSKLDFIEKIAISHFDTTVLTYLKRRLHLSGIKVGFILDINACIPFAKDVSKLPILAPFFKEVDFLYFSYIPLHPSTPGYKIGVDRIVPQVISWFEVCKRKWNNILPGKEIALETGYSDTLYSIKDDYLSLVSFWRKINKWAERTNTTILMFEAFDTIHYPSPDLLTNMGWWKFSSNIDDVERESGIRLVEKRLVALKLLTKSLSKNKQSIEGTQVTVKVVAAALLTLLGFLLLAIIYKIRKAKKNKLLARLETELTHSDIITLPKSAFVSASSTLIGIGNFGTVYKCFMPQFQAVVAVKTTSSDREFTDDCMGDGWKCLLSEVKIMRHVGKHENILPLLGVCQENCFYIVTEYCENGSLLSYLRSECGQNAIPPMYDLLQFCMDIANGMQFLEEKEVIHGDLSARNVLLDGSKTCKLSDFGLSRKLYQKVGYIKQGTEPLPWRWMAPESLARKLFTYKSDVWSMGVTFWEIFTLGDVPFPDMSWDATFCDRLMDGMRLKQPEICVDNVYQLLLLCWEAEERCRPSAKKILENLKELRSLDYAIL